MFRRLLLALFLGALVVPAAHAQSVDEILAKHYEAQGGLTKLKGIQSIRMTGKMAVGPGMEAPIVLERKRPGKSRMEFVFQGMTGVQAFDGEKGWSVMPFMGKKDPEASTDEDNKSAKDNADFDGVLVDWKAKGHAVELAGRDSVDGAACYKLKVTKKNGDVEYEYIDAETYLLVKNEGKIRRRGTEIEGETTFSDYKDVDGVMTFFTMESGMKGAPQKQKMSFDKVELNVPLADSHFVMPVAAATTDSSRTPAADTTKAKAAAKKPAAKKGK